jgi:hypothetical protein
MEAKGQSSAALTMSPLLSSQYLDPYCVFYVSPSPHHKKVLESHIYIVGYRSSNSIEAKKVEKGPTGGRWEPSCGQEVGSLGGSSFFLVALHVDFLFSRFPLEVNVEIHLRILRTSVFLIRVTLLMHFTFVIAIVLEVIYIAITLLLVLLSISCWCT